MKNFLIISAAAFFLGACSGSKNPANEKQVVAEDPEKVNTLLSGFISEHLAGADTSRTFSLAHDSLAAIAQVQQLYAKHGFKALWSDKGKLNAAGNSLFAVLKDAEGFGLIPDDYHYSLIDSLLTTAYDSKEKSFNVNQLADADMLLSDAFFTFAVHVSVGRMANDSATTREWRIHRLDKDLVQLFETPYANKNFAAAFESLEPQRLEYQSIKKYMLDFRKKYAGAKWQHLPERKADSLGFYTGIKTRLTETGDYDSAAVADNDSVRVSEALKKFQKRYFLESDGKIGRNTILALNMTPEDWMHQLAMNLERWRWEPAKFEPRHMLVNLPAFKMTVFEEDTIVMESRIVCGAVKTQTPELDSKVNQIVLYPYWNVPYSIAWKELLPHLKRDTAYLRKEHYEVLNSKNELVDPKTINWKRYSKTYLPFKFRQMTGDENALGIMKFEFNNKYSVYMHDTNSKKYFRFTTRAFSHGCMRLEDYMDLAHFLIRDDSVKLPRDTFDYWTTLGDQRKLNLRKPLPIHVRYFTCDVDTDGNVSLHTDIYLRDLRMEKVLYGKSFVQKTNSEKPVPVKSPAKTEKKALLRRKEQGFEGNLV